MYGIRNITQRTCFILDLWFQILDQKINLALEGPGSGPGRKNLFCHKIEFPTDKAGRTAEILNRE